MTTKLRLPGILGAIALGAAVYPLATSIAEPPPMPVSYAQHLTPAGAHAEFTRAMMEQMAKMDQEMAAVPMTGDPDLDFAAMMIPHHQGAIDMARPFLLHGKDPALRRLAEEIIGTQAEEIKVLQARLTALRAGVANTSP